MFKILIGVLAAAFIVIIGFMVIDPKVNNDNIISSSSNEPNTTTITIEGEVNKPGTYTMEAGSTMGDLISAAGGITSIADERCFYHDSLLTIGKSYYIAPLYDVNDVCNTQELEKVNSEKEKLQAKMDKLLEVFKD